MKTLKTEKSTKFKDMLKKLAYLICLALVDLSDTLLLFAFPVIIFDKLKSLWLTAGIMMVWPITRGLIHLLINRLSKRSDTRFLYLLGFTLIFIMIIVLNRQFTVYLLPVLLILWGAGTELVRMSLAGIRREYFGEYIGNWDFLERPVQAFALLVAPVFAFTIIMGGSYADVFNFLGLVIAVTALIFFFALNKPLSGNILTGIKPHFNWEYLRTLNRSAFFVSLIEGMIWLQLPIIVVINALDQGAWAYLVPAFLLPYFLLALFKNVFRLRIWQLQTWVKYFLAGGLLVCGYFAGNISVLLVLLFLLGVVFGLIMLADQHEKLQSDLDDRIVFASILGFFCATLWVLVVGNYLKLQNQMALLGSVVVAYGLWKRFSNRLKPMKWIHIKLSD